ncbi:hypothetical protein J1614_002561 [Plenodomus biglobosus]|nr:hypothetical protein J1614_002561 [Plenodomus biglobosus]
MSEPWLSPIPIHHVEVELALPGFSKVVSTYIVLFVVTYTTLALLDILCSNVAQSSTHCHLKQYYNFTSGHHLHVEQGLALKEPLHQDCPH